MRKLLLLFFDKSNFTRNFFTLLLGNSLAQLIPVAVSPILARLYTPSQFGEFSIYYSLTQVLCVSACFRYELAIILPKLFKNAANLVLLTHILSIIFFALVVSIVIIFSNEIHVYLGVNSFVVLYILIPLTVLFLAFYQVYFFWCNREHLYRVLSRNRVSQAIVISLLSIIFGLIGYKSHGLIIANFIGLMITTISLGWIVWNRTIKVKESFSTPRLFFLLRKYKDFPKYSMISAFIEKIAGQIPSLLLISFFSSNILGFYALAQKVAAFPVALIATSISAVFRQEAAEQIKKIGECKKLFLQTAYKLIALGFIPFLILFIGSPFLFKVIFGISWVQAGRFTQIISFMTYLQFVVSPLSGMFVIAEKQKFDLFLQIYLISAATAALLAGRFLFDSPEIAVTLFVSVYSIKYLIEFYLSYQFSLGKKGMIV